MLRGQRQRECSNAVIDLIGQADFLKIVREYRFTWNVWRRVKEERENYTVDASKLTVGEWFSQKGDLMSESDHHLVCTVFCR